MKQRRQLCAVFILIVLLISLEAPEAAVNKRRRAKSAAKHLAKRLAKAQLQKSKKASKGPKGSKVTQQMNYAAAVSICHAKLKSLPDGEYMACVLHQLTRCGVPCTECLMRELGLPPGSEAAGSAGCTVVTFIIREICCRKIHTGQPAEHTLVCPDRLLPESDV